MPEIVVHHLEQSRSNRVLWFLEELDLPYTIRRYERDPKTFRAPDSLRRVHPLGKSPVVEIDGIVVAESGAILEHLIEALGADHLRPSEPAALRRYRFYLHYAEGTLMPPLLVKLILGKIRTAPVPFFLKPVTRGIAHKIDASYSGPEITSHLRFLEQDLGERPWLTGDELSAADIQMSYPLEALLTRASTDHAAPRLAALLDRMRARPAFQRAIDKGGPVMPDPD